MKALIVSAEWEPRKEHRLMPKEAESRKAQNASRVWRHPVLTLIDLPDPSPGPDEVLIKVTHCGICGSDTHCYETDGQGYVIYSGPAKFPVVMGHEFSGEVVEAGKGVKSLKKGDLVAVEGMLWCGICVPCRSGNPNQCWNLEMVGFSSQGAFADLIISKEKYCWKLNDLLSVFGSREAVLEVGALIEPAGCSYNGMFVSGGGFKPGARVVVYGAGPIGLAAVVLARVAGASMVISFDPQEERLRLAKEMGADFSFSPDALKREGLRPSDMILELTNGEGAEVQVEAAGAAPLTLPEIERSFAANGKMIYLGRAAAKATMFLDVIVSQANQIAGARGHAGYGIFPMIIRLLGTGRLPIHKMITSRFPFSRIMEGLDRSRTRKDGKIMIKME